MTLAAQLFCHFVGDYFLQSDWMANFKSKHGAEGTLAAAMHATWYTLPFAIVSISYGHMLEISQLLLIAAAHFAVDRYKLAKYVIIAKNTFLNPPHQRVPADQRSPMGFNKIVPDHIQWGVFTVIDNTLHIMINAFIIGVL